MHFKSVACPLSTSRLMLEPQLNSLRCTCVQKQITLNGELWFDMFEIKIHTKGAWVYFSLWVYLVFIAQKLFKNRNSMRWDEMFDACKMALPLIVIIQVGYFANEIPQIPNKRCNYDKLIFFISFLWMIERIYSHWSFVGWFNLVKLLIVFRGFATKKNL